MRAILGTIACLLVLSSCAVGHSESPPDKAAVTGSVGSADPLKFHDNQGSTCIEIDGTYLRWDAVSTSRPVTLTSAAIPDGKNASIDATFVTTRPKKEIVSTGMALGTRPDWRSRDNVDWAHRAPLAGARLKPGETYYFFLRLRIEAPGGWKRIALGWTDGDGATGTSTFHDDLTIKEHCR